MKLSYIPDLAQGARQSVSAGPFRAIPDLLRTSSYVGFGYMGGRWRAWHHRRADFDIWFGADVPDGADVGAMWAHRPR